MSPLDLLRARSTVTASGCWLWQGARSANGYAVLRWRGRLVYGHRLALMCKLHQQRRAIGGFLACHQCQKHGAPCDQKACVNPAHLERGQHSRNHKERYARDRARARALEIAI